MANLIFKRPAADEYDRWDVDRMIEVLEARGHTVSRADAHDAWKAHSESSCATWLILPDSDDDLVDELLRILDEA